MTQERTIPGEERRLVTVLFADLVGYTSVSEARDPELMQEALNLCFDCLSAEIRRFGGYVDKVVGDEIMALFGAPRAQEDDAGKAVAAALAMQRALEELAPQLQERLGQGFSMRVGINTGLVVTGAVGPGGYTVTGDAVNVAARLEKAAEPGAVLVGESTRRLARRQFRWGERQEFPVKGRTEPVVCYAVEELRAAPLRLVPAPSETPFVGREEHLQRIREVWAATGMGPARVLQVVGEAGIGKTRLLAHLFATAGTPPEQVLYTRADTPPRTFGPLLQLLPSLRENLPRGFQERVEALARAHEVAEAPEVEPDWLVDGLTEVIRALAADGPVALVLDDMHRADSATVDVVEKLLPRLCDVAGDDAASPAAHGSPAPPGIDGGLHYAGAPVRAAGAGPRAWGRSKPVRGDSRPRSCRGRAATLFIWKCWRRLRRQRPKERDSPSPFRRPWSHGWTSWTRRAAGCCGRRASSASRSMRSR